VKLDRCALVSCGVMTGCRRGREHGARAPGSVCVVFGAAAWA
jgi:Zn-dependent alcohol dehydrogenase